MRIACISASKIPASTANSIQAMKACQALAQLGHQVHLLVPAHGQYTGSRETGTAVPGKGYTPDQTNEDDLASHYGLQTPFDVEWLPANPRLKRYDFSLKAVARARVLKADVAYLWPLQAAMFAALGRMPVLLELHGPPEGKAGPWLFRLFLRLRARKRLLPITQALADLLNQTYRITQTALNTSTLITPNGVDLERYQDLPEPPYARRSLCLPERFTVGYTGHLYPGRGMTLLVELAHRYPQIHFLWIGGHPSDVNAWRARLASEGITNVTLTGFIPNARLPAYQAAADILLMPYERFIEGSSGGNSADYCSPMKMFEYMACGRAIISSDLPVIQEVLDEGNAVLCPPEDVDAWAGALDDLMNDAPKRTSIGNQARQDVQSYTWLARARRALEGFE